MSSLPSGVRRMNRWTRNAEQRRENFYYEALAFSRHNNNLVFEENMKPERPTMAPENAGIDPSTMRISRWYQESTREDDRVSDFAGAERMSYQVREPVKIDEDRRRDEER